MFNKATLIFLWTILLFSCSNSSTNKIKTEANPKQVDSPLIKITLDTIEKKDSISVIEKPYWDQPVIMTVKNSILLPTECPNRTVGITDSTSYLMQKIEWLQNYIKTDTLISEEGTAVLVGDLNNTGCADVGACGLQVILKHPANIKGNILVSKKLYSNGSLQPMLGVNDKVSVSYFNDSIFKMTLEDRKYGSLNIHFTDTIERYYKSTQGGPIWYRISKNKNLVVAYRGYRTEIEYAEGGWDVESFNESKIAIKRKNKWEVLEWRETSDEYSVAVYFDSHKIRLINSSSPSFGNQGYYISQIDLTDKKPAITRGSFYQTIFNMGCGY